MQCPCQQNFVFILTSEKEKPVPKYHIFKRFWLWFWYVSLLLFNPFSCQLVPKCHTHLSKPGTFSCRFKYICPFITTRHERVKTCSNMIFNALRILLMVLWSESRNGPVSNILNPVVPLFWFGSYEQLRNNLHGNWWSSVCVILFLCTITDIIVHNVH